MDASKSPITLTTILDQFREDARSNRDLGDRFERLMLRYFELDSIYADRFSKVWMWNDWPLKGKVGDVGVDLVAQERATGDYCAIQCKFYLPEHTLSKVDIDSFFTAFGRDPFTTGIIVSTTDHWGKNAQDALNQSKPVTRLSIHDLEASNTDWSTFNARRLDKLTRRPKKQIGPYQQVAMKAVTEKFATADRGKLIMACGTGKTLTSLRIAESIAPEGHVLFLVPSLSLLSQALREWTAEAMNPIRSLAVCSDANIGKSRKKNADDSAEITIHDLAFPATTNAKQLVAQFEAIRTRAKKDKSPAQMTVFFSTYQSIDAVSKAQKAGLPKFDLVICDEAHRTTGVTLTGEDESHFVKVHDAEFLKATKRLYMTATPRIYGDQAKTVAKQAEAELASMDDPKLFGDEFHRLGFGEAVSNRLLSDYKVLVLAVDEKYVSKTFQKQIADSNNELNLDDAVKITGCWNGLWKKFESSVTTTADFQGDVAPMRRAVAFSRSIKDSKAFVQKFGQIVAAFKESHADADGLLEIEADHVDGTFDALRRGALLDWLKAQSPDNTCRILSNARCLSEGVDVPALDAVIFLNPRNSVIDVVQSVGRVMRRAPGKRYGYIILPVGIPADMTPEDALKDNEKYKVVWQVLQALRAHDDRFNATINQLELNHNRPENIQVIGVGGGGGGDGDGAQPDASSPGDSQPTVREVQGVFAFPQLDEWKDAIYAKVVLKCGDRAYWETWARDIAAIAERHITRIKALLDDNNARHAQAFAEFLAGLQANLNPAVTRDDAIEMLAQHLITRPIFDALFANYAFTQQNPVSQSMQKMLDLLHEEAIEKEAATLEKFYASVRDRAKGIDNAEARQRVIRELYDEFFRAAFPRLAERLGIVYTPEPVVDFIIKSVEDVLRDEFQSGLGDKDIHIIDPFTGTGTFIVRLLQSGLIPPKDLLRKYKHELHANEIVLLAYYIAAINIEETFHALYAAGRNGKNGANGYIPFDGIVLTDTFQLYEPRGEIIEMAFPENNQRVRRQKAAPIRVVISNPPYSVGQGDANANNQNLDYLHLDKRIASTYAARSTATNKNSLYDSYVRAIRWASDRIETRGIIGFVTNGYFIDGNAMDGLRSCLCDEFSSIYIFNLRGNQRTSGEVSRQEGGKIFGSGARTPVAITLLIKNPDKAGQCELRYHDIGDYLSREEKLKIIRDFGSVGGIQKAAAWTTLEPNASHDWINQRDEAFGQFLTIGNKDDANSSVFAQYSGGLKTNRDAWCYNFSRPALGAIMSKMLAYYEVQRRAFSDLVGGEAIGKRLNMANEFIDRDKAKIQWSDGLVAALAKLAPRPFEKGSIRVGHYRPFCKQGVYFHSDLNDRVYRLPLLFPTPTHENVAICTTAAGNREGFSVFITNIMPDVHMSDKSGATQCFPRFLYEEAVGSGKLDYGEAEEIDGYHRRDAITDVIHKRFREAYGPEVSKEDIFYYVYGVLHSPEYRRRFAADLKKMLPRIPLTGRTEDFRAFSKAGRDLAQWHLNYETVEPFPVVEHSDTLALNVEELFKVQTMTFGRADKAIDKTTIVYNSHIRLSKIPLEAYEYVVNGKPAIEWIMERYQVTRDKDSGIVNNPNDWASEHNQPRYIIDLVKRIVRVSLETMKIVSGLPALNAV
jgi:predicted helicase